MVYIADAWREQLHNKGLNAFEDFWDMEVPRADEPNTGRDGWSEVCRYELNDSDININALYVKRQENFTTFSWQHLLEGQATFEREFENIMLCIRQNFPVVTPVYFATRDDAGKHQAILITESLDSMDACDNTKAINKLTVTQRRSLIRIIAHHVKSLHDIGYQHGCLYPKHIFYKIDKDSQPEVRFIDLEKLAKTAWYRGGKYRDLDSLSRRSYNFSMRDKLYFLKSYTDGDKYQMHQLIKELTK